MEAKTIVAIEIASSKIKGAAATMGVDGHLTILAVDEVAAADNVRYGRVQNIREVSAAVNEIVRRLEEAPAVKPRRVQALAISLGGRSLSGQPAKASLKFPHECEITEKQVQRLAFEATHDFIGDKNIEATVPRVFFVNSSAVRQPVGTFGDSFRGEFTMITCGKETRQNLERLKFDNIDSDRIAYLIRPTAVAEFVLTPDEKELGAAIVDVGAETTTVAVYKDGTLAALSTIPMGSRLITLDLTVGMGITEEAAEKLKTDLAANPDTAEDDVKGYAHARAGEIAANVLNQLEFAGYPTSSLTKVVLTGGGARLADFGEAIANQGKIAVRTADMPADVTFRVPGKNNADNIDVVALALAASRRLPFQCLVTPVNEDITVSEIMNPAAFVDEEEEIPQDEIPQDETIDNTVYQGRKPSRPTIVEEEDDESLLSDDIDDEPETTSRRGIFSGFGRRKAAAKNTRYDEEDELEPEEEEYEETEDPEIPDQYIEPEVNPRTTSSSERERERNVAKEALEKIKGGLLKFFTPDENEEDDSDE